LEVTASIAEHLSPAWCGLAQVCRLTRQRIIRGETTIETVYAITSLRADKADAARLLDLSRQHWGIENRLHYVRDVTWREDRRVPTLATHHRRLPHCATRPSPFCAVSASSLWRESNTSPNIVRLSMCFSHGEPNDPD
jgi:hypothetical protein